VKEEGESNTASDAADLLLCDIIDQTDMDIWQCGRQCAHSALTFFATNTSVLSVAVTLTDIRLRTQKNHNFSLLLSAN